MNQRFHYCIEGIWDFFLRVLEFWRFENFGEFENLRVFEDLRVFKDLMIFLYNKNLALFFVNGFSIYREKVLEFEQRCGLDET